ncbi:MAG TPA: RAD52 family DNA repair protein [Chloroflexia bacterium]|nr:RAD52 family DNA repair protein [Chloroflexia bacterium]
MSESPFTPEQIAQLDQPLDPRRVKHRQGGGGVQLAYLKGHDVIDTANHIFGYGNWGYDLLSVDLNNIPGENGEVIGGFYSARVRLTVANCVPITEEGVCAIQEGRNPRAKIDAHDMARKGAITDALKRALRCFGDQFGNSLYDTDLVDGQPRESSVSRGTNGNRAQHSQGVSNRNAREATSLPPEAPAVAGNRATNGAANGHSNRPASPVAQNGSAPAPARNGRTAVVEPPASQNNGLVSEEQLAVIQELAESRRVSTQALENRCRELFGVGTAQLNREQADELIAKMRAVSPPRF